MWRSRRGHGRPTQGPKTDTECSAGLAQASSTFETSATRSFHERHLQRKRLVMRTMFLPLTGVLPHTFIRPNDPLSSQTYPGMHVRPWGLTTHAVTAYGGSRPNTIGSSLLEQWVRTMTTTRFFVRTRQQGSRCKTGAAPATVSGDEGGRSTA